jgi:hypothetical protein
MTQHFKHNKVFIWAITATSYPVSKHNWPLFNGIKVADSWSASRNYTLLIRGDNMNTIKWVNFPGNGQNQLLPEKWSVERKLEALHLFSETGCHNSGPFVFLAHPGKWWIRQGQTGQGEFLFDCLAAANWTDSFTWHVGKYPYTLSNISEEPRLQYVYPLRALTYKRKSMGKFSVKTIAA